MRTPGVLSDAVSALAAGLSGVRRQFSARSRRAWRGGTRAHVELKRVASSERERLERSVAEDVGALTGVRAVRFNPATGRVVAELDAGGPELEEIVAAVERGEASAGFAGARFHETQWEHPADSEAAERLWVALSAEVFAVALGTALRFSLVPASRLSGTVASLLQIIQTSPRLRRGLDERFGPLRADLVLDVGAALGHGLAQRPGSALVELAHRAVQLGETNARRRTWEAREPDLFDPLLPPELTRGGPEERPCPLPRGPIEEYSDRAVWVSLAGFGVSFLATRSVQRAVAALFGGLPKPAELGRDVFASELGRTLARRGVLVLDPSVLRRLDRIDCLVLPHDLVARHRWEVRALLRLPHVDEASVHALVGELFDPDQPVLRRTRGDVVLEPFGARPLELPTELLGHAQTLGAQGGLVL
ncbi:MAG TPA: hypothetical protein VGQ57_10010, partial [Polyangiaceae bacterium]|nr:hypothetical protein [Polyangiaceae bacterium]